MSLIYTAIGKGDIILSEYTSYSGNFAVTAFQILKTCGTSKKYMRFSVGNYVFYTVYANVIYLIMCEREYSQRIAFSYLEKLRKLFETAYSEQRISVGKMYEFMEFAKVIKSNMELYNTPEEVDNVARLLKASQEVSQFVNEDLQKVIDRGEKIQILVRKTEVMSSLSLDLSSSSRQVKRQMVWRNWGTRILIGVVIMVVIYFVLVMVCGSFSLSGCF